jgi:acyl-lipid omega-6 desaturase (Delta-12 desaturase)
MLVDSPEYASLSAVRAVIPEECYQRSRLRSAISVARDGALYLAVIAALVLVDTWWLAAPLVILAGLVVSAMFIIGHDAAHQSLFEGRRANRVVATVMMLPSLHVHEAWVLGHNRVHHGYTAQQGMDFVWHPITPTEYLTMSRLERLRHRLEWSWAGAGAYYLRGVWWEKMIRFTPPGRNARNVQRDKAIVAAWFVGASAAAAAAGWGRGGAAGAAVMWLKLVGGPFLVFTQIIGWTVYVHHIDPDIRWWPRRQWSRWRGQVEATTILRIPRLLNVFFHHIFVHVPHHVDMRLPWYRLPRAAAALHAAFPEFVAQRRFRLRDYVRSVRRCKLYDFEHGRWLTYAQARQSS